MYSVTVSAFILPVTVHAGMIIQHVFTTEQNKKYSNTITWDHIRV